MMVRAWRNSPSSFLPYSPRERRLCWEGRVPIARQRLASAPQRGDDRRNSADRPSRRCVCGRAGDSLDLLHSRGDLRGFDYMQLG